jgi:hypothetical protein
VYCARHPAIDATRECSRCGVLHCEGCVRKVGTDRQAIAACAHCDGVLTPLAVRVVPPVREEARALLRRPFTPTGLVTAGSIGVVMGMSDLPVPLVDLAIGVVGLIALAASFFNVLEHVARGKPGFPAPAEVDGLTPATLASRGLLCLMVLAAPFAIWLARTRGAESVSELAAARPFVAILLGLLALGWLTAALVAMLLAGSGLAAFWPPALVRAVALDPASFARLYGLVAASSAAMVLLRLTFAFVAGAVPFVSTALVAAVTALAVFAQAALVGGFIHRHRESYPTR